MNALYPASCALRAPDSAPKKPQILQHICIFIDSDEFFVPKTTLVHYYCTNVIYLLLLHTRGSNLAVQSNLL